MWVAPRWRMRRYVLAMALTLLAGDAAQALTLQTPRVEATLMATSAKDPFRIRGVLAGADLAAVADGPVTVRFGELRAHVPAGGFRRRGAKDAWKSYLLGVKKVSINLKKGTIDVQGGGIELGELPGPVTVTHNRRSMEIVDRLYGVTMERQGVSKIVTVSLEGFQLH